MSIKPSLCKLCHSPLIGPALNLGDLPACNHFHSGKNAIADLFFLCLMECQSCHLIQLKNIPPISFTRPRFPWIKYNEPEAHLEKFAITLNSLLPKENCSILGIGPFDMPLLTHFKNKDHIIQSIDLLTTEEKGNSFPYLETIQARLNPIDLNSLVGSSSKYDIIIFRYLLEHCNNPTEALMSLKNLMHNNSLMVVEVPDSTKFLEKNDYSFIWEEHVFYFNEFTLRTVLEKTCFDVIEIIKYPGQLEDVLLAITKPAQSLSTVSRQEKYFSPFNQYCSSFKKIKCDTQVKLRDLNKQNKKIALFGAGHQAMMYLNALKLAEFISYIIDDDTNKQKLYAPGTEIPIVDTSILFQDLSVTTCLLAVHPRIENLIISKLTPFIERGGKVFSIFQGSQMPTILEDKICA